MTQTSEQNLPTVEDVNRLCRFFFLTLLNDKMADFSIQMAFKHYRKTLRKKMAEDTVSNASLLVECAYKTWRKFLNRYRLAEMAPSHSSYWRIGSNFDLAPWFELRKSIDPDVYFPLVWSHVLGVPERDVAKAMGITEGTVRYRVGKGVLQLGQLSSQYEMKA